MMSKPLRRFDSKHHNIITTSTTLELNVVVHHRMVSWHATFITFFSFFPIIITLNASVGTTAFTYVACYKPALTLCSLQPDFLRAERKNRDPRQTLADLDLPEKLHIVGRLDRDSEGLLLLTDDGQFTSRVLSAGCEKEYWALVNGGTPSEEKLDEMRSGGLNIRGSITRPPVSIDLLDPAERDEVNLPAPAPGMTRGASWIKLVLNEGKNRQARKITLCAGHKTVRLCRVAIGSFRLQDHEDLLVPGSWKYIQMTDVLAKERDYL